MRPPLLREFIDHVVGTVPWPDHCVFFPGRRQPNGYGRVSVDGRYERAHVYACRTAHGPRPAGKTDAAHSCGTSMCINPRHLSWATRAENEADKVRHGTSNRGERSAVAVLNGDAVRSIRSRYAAGGITQQQLATEHGVHIMTINDIIHLRTWKEPF